VFKSKGLFLWGALAGVGIGVLVFVDYTYLMPAQRFSRILLDNERYQLSVVQVISDIPVRAHPEGDHIHYTTSGHAVMNIDGKEVKTGPGTTTVIPANIPHGTKLNGKSLSYFHVIVYVSGLRTSRKGE
jgi:quercetin dioxygenase-like cupin family protein